MTSKMTPNDRSHIKQLIAIVVFIVFALLVYRLFFGGPSSAESAQVVCELQSGDDVPLVDPTKSNSRSDFASALRARANALSDAADETSGDTRKALTAYAEAMQALATSVESDSTGRSLAAIVSQLATDPKLSSAEETLNDILDRLC